MTTTVPTDDQARLDLVRTRLSTAVLSDVIDSLGFRAQAMDARIRPMWDGAIVVGRAHTLLTVDIFEVRPDPYRMEIEAVDTLKPHDVLVGATNASRRTCLWGELLSTAARCRGANGAIIDGYVRDVRQIAAMGFPVFGTGMKPVDSAGRSVVVEYGTPVSCGDVVVREGDLVMADLDGVIVIPQEIETDAIRLAFAKVEGENRTREALLSGLTLTEVYAKFGIL